MVADEHAAGDSWRPETSDGGADPDHGVRFDVEGALSLARGLASLAAAAEAAFDRRERAAAAAAVGWTGPWGREFARTTAAEAARCRDVVEALRDEAQGWVRASVAAAQEAGGQSGVGR